MQLQTTRLAALFMAALYLCGVALWQLYFGVALYHLSADSSHIFRLLAQQISSGCCIRNPLAQPEQCECTLDGQEPPLCV